MRALIIFLIGFISISFVDFDNVRNKNILLNITVFNGESNIQFETESLNIIVKNSFEEEQKHLEKGLFSLSNERRELKKVVISIDNNEIILNLKKYRNNRFIAVSILLCDIENAPTILKIIRGNVTTTYGKCDSQNCHVATMEFPQLINENGKLTVKGHEAFDEYIFDY